MRTLGEKNPNSCALFIILQTPQSVFTVCLLQTYLAWERENGSAGPRRCGIIQTLFYILRCYIALWNMWRHGREAQTRSSWLLTMIRFPVCLVTEEVLQTGCQLGKCLGRLWWWSRCPNTRNTEVSAAMVPHAESVYQQFISRYCLVLCLDYKNILPTY